MSRMVKFEGFDKNVTRDEIRALLSDYGPIEVFTVRKKHSTQFLIDFQINYKALLATHYFNDVYISGNRVP